MYAVMWVKIILLILPSFLLLFNKPFLGTFNAEESGNTNRSRSCPQGERCFWRKEKWRQAQGVIRQRLNEYQTCREDGGAGKGCSQTCPRASGKSQPFSTRLFSPQASWAGQSECAHVLRYGQHRDARKLANDRAEINFNWVP